MAKLGCSVSVYAQGPGGMLWSVTRESWRVRKGREYREDECREGYAVVRGRCGRCYGGDHEHVAFSLLNCASVETLVQRVRKEMRTVMKGVSCLSVFQYMQYLSNGAYSTEGCRCCRDKVCGACMKVDRQRRKYVAVDMYCGSWPYGEDHWFTGISDVCSEGWYK